MSVLHVVGCGTIGEPLANLFATHREALGVSEVTCYKRTPRPEDTIRLQRLARQGVRLAVDTDRRTGFERLGLTPELDASEALERASVVVDCTPAGNQHREGYRLLKGPRGFLAQGSERGFGKPCAWGVNDASLVPGADRFLQVVSCNTHALAALVSSLAFDPHGSSHLVDGRFVCMRRGSDVGDEGHHAASPTVQAHDDARFGTHHARDVHDVFATLGHDLSLWSSVVVLNTQYMHAIWFSLTLDEPVDLPTVIKRLRASPQVALTRRRSSSGVFSFGRNHGFAGRILNNVVVPLESLAVRGDREVVGTCFTPQDGNSLLTSMSAATWLMDPASSQQRLKPLWNSLLFPEV